MFNVRKSAQVATWFLRQGSGHMPHLKLMRLMYLAGRAAPTAAPHIAQDNVPARKMTALQETAMQTILDTVKPKPARKQARPRSKFDLPADEYLRLDRANEKALLESCRAAERGELVEYDPRKR